MPDDAVPPIPDPVEAQWQRLRSLDTSLVQPELVEAAYANPCLRILYPMVSHGWVYFSRCTDYPWSQDIPSIAPRSSGYEVIDLRREEHACRLGVFDNPAEAVALVVANLPDGCGPAVVGGPDKLRK